MSTDYHIIHKVLGVSSGYYLATKEERKLHDPSTICTIQYSNAVGNEFYKSYYVYKGQLYWYLSSPEELNNQLYLVEKVCKFVWKRTKLRSKVQNHV